MVHPVRFREPARARENLDRLRPRLAAVSERSLLSLLAQLPDPDGSLNMLERFTSAAADAPAQEGGAKVLDYLAAHPAALHYLLAIFSYSSFLSETLLREPEMVVRLHQDPALFRLKSREEMLADHCANRSSESTGGGAMARAWEASPSIDWRFLGGVLLGTSASLRLCGAKPR